MDENQKKKPQEGEEEKPSAIQTFLTTIIFVFLKVIIFSYILQFGWNNSIADIGLVPDITFGQSLSLYLLMSAAASMFVPTTISPKTN